LVYFVQKVFDVEKVTRQLRIVLVVLPVELNQVELPEELLDAWQCLENQFLLYVEEFSAGCLDGLVN
jgi:hypothetical protein